MGRGWHCALVLGAVTCFVFTAFQDVAAAEKRAPKTQKAVYSASQPRQAVIRKPEPLLLGERNDGRKGVAADPLEKDCGCAARWGGVWNATRYAAD